MTEEECICTISVGSTLFHQDTFLVQHTEDLGSEEKYIDEFSLAGVKGMLGESGCKIISATIRSILEISVRLFNERLLQQVSIKTAYSIPESNNGSASFQDKTCVEDK